MSALLWFGFTFTLIAIVFNWCAERNMDSKTDVFHMLMIGAVFLAWTALLFAMGIIIAEALP